MDWQESLSNNKKMGVRINIVVWDGDGMLSPCHSLSYDETKVEMQEFVEWEIREHTQMLFFHFACL